MSTLKEKIAKLLALAQSPEPEEARSALLRARELMAKHKLSPEDVGASKASGVRKALVDVTCTTLTDPWAAQLSAVIAERYCYDPAKVAAAEPWQVKHDALGDFIWETVMGYKFEDDLPYGHGEKSVYIISAFMKLSREEAMAIRWHMGFSDNDFKGGGFSVGNAFAKYPLALLTHIADLQATYLDEADGAGKDAELFAGAWPDGICRFRERLRCRRAEVP